ncbi:MAG: hypothetical protein H0W88_09070 [Parachlamydiaceae bacterium]|nr:hypothetical protein [Parachlamydiaceae bacterium]
MRIYPNPDFSFFNNQGLDKGPENLNRQMTQQQKETLTSLTRPAESPYDIDVQIQTQSLLNPESQAYTATCNTQCGQHTCIGTCGYTPCGCPPQ